MPLRDPPGGLRIAAPKPARQAPGRVWAGALIGATCGFLTYWGGAAFAASKDLMAAPKSSLPPIFLRPILTFTAWEVVLVLIGLVVGWALARYNWRAAGLLSYVGLLSLVAGYVIYTVTVSIPRVPPDERWLSYVLLAAEAAGLTLFCIFSFYSLDAATRRRWRRVPEPAAFDPDHCPKVAFEVPVYNEPFEMVQQTIAHLMRQNYPRDRFAVVVADDSTDPELRARIAEFCQQVGAAHVTRPDRRGFKAGALNYANAHLAEDFEFIAVVDADYWVAPDYLRSLIGYFVDPLLGFVQTPQDYRNVEESFLTRQYKRAESYFYHAIMPSRNEASDIIFCGTMGILRRAALEGVGGFDETQICEDAELSVRLAIRGWHSLYVNKSFGKGLMPAVFDSYKKQFHRWAFGNVRILFTRAGMILRSRMTLRQKFDFIVSNLHWFDGLFLVAIAFVLLFLGVGPLVGQEFATHHQRELTLLAIIPIILLMDSMVRLLIVLARSGRVRLFHSFLVQGMWFAIKMTNLQAVVKAALGFKAPFVRTPKLPVDRLHRWQAFWHAIRITKMESLLSTALLSVAGVNAYHAWQNGLAAGTGFVAGWLALFAMFFLCAPVYAYLSYRTLTPLTYAGVPIPSAARRQPAPAPAGARPGPVRDAPSTPSA